MTRRTITDEIWQQLIIIMKEKGCQNRKSNREIMEAILWKLRTGSPWRDIPTEFCPWQTAFNRFNRWAEKGLWADFFLNYEAMLIKNGYSSTEVMSALISMRVELTEDKNEPSDDLLGDLQPRYTCPPTRMEIRFILKSLGVKLTTQKLLHSSSKK